MADQAEPQPGDDEVGYRKPPKQHRFKPGQSGNPRGRPKGALSLRKILANELEGKVMAQENGRQVKISRLAAIIKAQTFQAAKGRVSAAAWLVGLHIQAEGFQDERPEGERLSPADQAIMARFLADQFDEPTVETVEADPEDEGEEHSGEQG